MPIASDRMLHEEDRRAAEAVRLDGVAAEDVGRLVGLLGELRAARSRARPPRRPGRRSSPGPSASRSRRTCSAAATRCSGSTSMAPDIPEVLGTLGLDAEADDAEPRVALARHLTRPDHPLTARVMVNRVWQHHFGTGLVATPSDFGRMGAAAEPSRTARLAGRRVRPQRVVDQASPPADPHVQHLPAGEHPSRRRPARSTPTAGSSGGSRLVDWRPRRSATRSSASAARSTPRWPAPASTSSTRRAASPTTSPSRSSTPPAVGG